VSTNKKIGYVGSEIEGFLILMLKRNNQNNLYYIKWKYHCKMNENVSGMCLEMMVGIFVGFFVTKIHGNLICQIREISTFFLFGIYGTPHQPLLY
jgi:hypothetical protein